LLRPATTLVPFPSWSLPSMTSSDNEHKSLTGPSRLMYSPMMLTDGPMNIKTTSKSNSQ
jgi:hypothetical protein